MECEVNFSIMFLVGLGKDMKMSIVLLQVAVLELQCLCQI